VENVKEEGVEVDIRVIETGRTSMQPMSTFSMLESMSLTQSEDGFFYDREHVQYQRTGEKGMYKYYLVTRILQPTSLSPTTSPKVETPITNMIEKSTLDSGSTSTLAPTTLLGVQVHTNVAGREIESESRSLESISTLSAFTMLESINLTKDANGYFYDKGVYYKNKLVKKDNIHMNQLHQF